MASSGSRHLKDIDEQFCQCPVCLQQYREPKLLPCLHRYCSDCLNQLIVRNQGVAVINCPECRDECPIPPDGVNGFKTDFFMQNIVEYIQIQTSLGDEKVRECYNCTQKLTVRAYCFKCNGFLCKECYGIHMNGKSLNDHKQHALSLEDLKSKHMTLEKLADLKEAPRCQSHFKELCLLCCRTCDDLPICVTCVHGRHKNHDIKDVGIYAAEVREKLQTEIKSLNQYREQMLKMFEEVERVKEDVTANLRKKKDRCTSGYQKDVKIVNKDIMELEEKYKLGQTEIENNKERELIEKRKQMDRDIEQIKIRYNNIFDEIKEQCAINLNTLKHKHEEDLQKRREKLATLEKDFQYFIRTLETREEEGLKKLQEISQEIDDVIGRYKNLTTTGYSVLETKNDWTAVQCIPNISKAIEPLSKDMKREFPELWTLSIRIGISPYIDEDDESPIHIEEIQANGWGITGITGGGDSMIVITGLARDCFSHVTVINMEGNVTRKRELQQTVMYPYRHCTVLSEFKIATACFNNEIGIVDVRDVSHIRKNISDITSRWPVGRLVTCVTTDSVNSHILVGGSNSRDVFVFDDRLNYHHTLTLPEMITYPYSIAINEGHLLVCDLESKGAYVVSMEGLDCKMIHELGRPNIDHDDWRPISVCTDSNGFIYVLWMSGNDLSIGRRAVAQFTQDGSQLLAVKQIDCNDARCVATIKTDKKEKLVLGRWKSGKIHVYNLS